MNEDRSQQFSFTAVKGESAAISRMFAILQAVGVGVWEMDVVSGVLTFDDTMYKLYGITREDFPDTMEAHRRAIHPDDKYRMGEGIYERIKAGESYIETNFRVIQPNGKIRFLAAKINIERTENGTPVRIFGADFDVTESVIAEEQKEAAAKKIAAILDAASIGSWEWDLRNQVVKWDDGILKLSGLSREEFPTNYEAFLNIVHPDDRESLRLMMAEVLAGTAIKYESRFRVRRSDGQIRYCSATWVIERTDDGAANRILGINIDMTQSALAEMEKTATLKKMANILDAVTIGTWEYDIAKNVLEFDDAMYRLYGVRREDFPNPFDANIQAIHPDDQGRLTSNVERNLSAGLSKFQDEFRVIYDDGEVRYLTVKTTVDRNGEGVPVRMSGVNYDVTSLVIAAEEKAKTMASLELERSKCLRNARLASLGEMAAGIAHEINNPLAIIAGTSRILQKFVTDPGEIKRRLDSIDRASHRIAKIVRSLRKFSRSDEKSDYRVHSLAEIIKEAVNLTETKSRRHSTPIQVVNSCPGIVVCDEIEMEQVLVNLINNGIDAADEFDEKWVRIDLFESDDTVIMQVRDSGKGINSEVQQKLFHPFFTTKPVGQGTGLGLSIVKGILDEHRASIDVLENDPNTCFEIRIPKAEQRVREI